VTRDDLDARNAAAIRRHWRDLVDLGGQPSAALLDDLAAVADEHARQRILASEHERVTPDVAVAPAESRETAPVAGANDIRVVPEGPEPLKPGEGRCEACRTLRPLDRLEPHPGGEGLWRCADRDDCRDRFRKLKRPSWA